MSRFTADEILAESRRLHANSEHDAADILRDYFNLLEQLDADHVARVAAAEQALAALRELELWRVEAALAQRDTAHPHARVVAALMQARVCMQLADEKTPFF